MEISLKTLGWLFRDCKNGFSLKYQGKCNNCENEVAISIIRTSSGFGFIGGILRELEPRSLRILCADCYKNGKLEEANTAETKE